MRFPFFKVTVIVDALEALIFGILRIKDAIVGAEKLNSKEKAFVARIMAAKKFDTLWYEVACLVPCTIIIVLGMINDSYIAIALGLVTYLLFRTRSVHDSESTLPILQSILSKTATENEEPPVWK